MSWLPTAQMEFAMVVGVCWYAQFGCEWSGGPLVVLDIMWVLCRYSCS
jgi:hypothetical protein